MSTSPPPPSIGESRRLPVTGPGFSTGVALGATWVVTRRLFSSRAAWWAVAIAAVNPDFLLGSVEFRTDQLWTGLWLATLAVLLTGRITRARAGVAGLLLGATFGASMKTSL